MLGFLSQFNRIRNLRKRTYKCSKLKVVESHHQLPNNNWALWNAILGRRESETWGIKGWVLTRRARSPSTTISKPSKSRRMRRNNQLHKILRAILIKLIQIKPRLRNSQFLEETSNYKPKLNPLKQKMSYFKIRDTTLWCSWRASSSLISKTTMIKKVSLSAT